MNAKFLLTSSSRVRAQILISPSSSVGALSNIRKFEGATIWAIE